MLLRDLVLHFADEKDFPLSADDIAEPIIKAGVVHQVNFYPDPAMNSAVLLGCLDRFKQEGNPPEFCEFADIYYPDSLSPAWKNLVEVKELCGVCDNGDENTRTRDGVDRLISEMVLPADVPLSKPTRTDKMALVWALLLLIPRSARDKLRPAFTPGGRNPTLAEFFGVPDSYIAWAFSPEYDAWYDTLVVAQPKKQPARRKR